MSFNNMEQGSARQVNKWEIIKAQLHLKWKMSSSVFIMLILVQLLGVFLSVGNTMGFSSYGQTDTLLVDVNLVEYTGDPMIVLSILSLIGLAFSYTFPNGKRMMTSYVANQQTYVWTNMIFLFFLSFILAILTQSLVFIVSIALFQIHGTEALLYASVPNLGQFTIGVFATILYMFLASVLAYLLGEIMQVSKFLFIVLLVFIFILLGDFTVVWMEGIKEAIKQFLFQEGRISIFFVKVVGIVVLAYGSIVALSHKREVR